VILLVLLAVCGTLQYRWLGDVSRAEQDRLRTSLNTSATTLARDFDREITRVYLAFHTESTAFDRDPAGVLADALGRAQTESVVGGIVKSVFLLDARRPDHVQLSRLDPTQRTLNPAEWPTTVEDWRRRGDRLVIEQGPLPLFTPDAIDAKAPALFVPIPVLERVEHDGHLAVLADSSRPARTIVVLLDADRLRHQLLDLLVARQFGPPETSEYIVTVVNRLNPSEVIFTSSTQSDVTPQNADISVGAFGLRLDEKTQFTAHLPTPPANDKSRLAITIVRRAGATDELRGLISGADQGAWRILVRARPGSLDALVARTRHRNMAISLGVLGLLGASFVFLIASAIRQQRLARQQMEFVAAVSHELRTPLAVIRSAGENLADGVVEDDAQVKRYGALIRAEGVRLSDMVERVMEFAGISSGTLIRPRTDVEITAVLRDAVAAVSADATERNIRIDLKADPDLPAVVGDPDALRSALQNVVANAVKYSASGATVDVRAFRDGHRVAIAVADRGLGIDAADLPHVFKPFFRGQRALDAQVRGTGVGLSVVRHVIDGHKGDVDIRSRVGEGTTVTIHLPAAPPRDGVVAEARATT
jgi:signal transduction histidine kinase